MKDIALGVYDGPHATPAPSDSGPVFLGIKNITEDGRLDLNDVRHIADEEFARWTKRVLPRKDDIVFSYEATLNRYALIPEGLKCCLGRRMALIRVDQTKVNPRFLYHYFFGGEWRNVIKTNSVVGATVDRLPIADFPEFPLRLPSLAEQDRIASVLSALDDKIALNTRINAELEAMAKLLYDYWFVQFDFPNAKGKPGSGAGPRPYKSSGGAMVFNAELKREVPEGWEVKPIGDLVYCYDNERVPLEKSVRAKRQGVIPYYGATGIFDYIDAHIFEGEYVLFAEDGSIMDAQGWPIVQFITGKAWVNNHAHVLQSKAEGHNEFIFQRLKKIPVVTVMTGSIQKKITGGNLLGYRIAYPGDKLVSAYCEAVKPMRATIFNLERQNQELTTLRDWLLPMLMNGQVVVGEAEEKMGLAMAAEGQAKYGKSTKA